MGPLHRQTCPSLTSADQVGTYVNHVFNSIDEIHLYGFNGPQWVVLRALLLIFLSTARMCGQSIKCSKLLNIKLCFNTPRRAGVTSNTPRRASLEDTKIFSTNLKTAVCHLERDVQMCTKCIRMASMGPDGSV